MGFLHAQNVSFIAVADNRSYTSQYRAALQEINDMSVNPEPLIPYPLFLVACGDIDPVASNMAIYNDTLAYPNLPSYYPVVGNHEFETPSDMDYILNSMIPNLKNLVNTGRQATYSFDYGNVHCIVLDEYSTNGNGEVDANLQAWLQQDLNTTDQDHVFVFGHEPAFPRYRHVGDSLDQFPESRNAFWNMLVIDPRVRAYFCGHTHYYYRMRVGDPTNVGTSGYPDQDGGVYQVDCGAIGNPYGEGRLTLVYVHVQEDSTRFRVITSPINDIQWEMTDEWSIGGLRRLAMQFIEPLSGDEVSGVTNVTWSFSGEPDESRTTTLYLSSDAGASWDTLWIEQTVDTTYTWNTANNPDGTRYMLRVVVKGDLGFGMAQSAGTFTINNPGNAVPEIALIAPTKGDTLTGECNVEWTAADADSDPLLISLETSTNDGATWQPLATDEQNDGIYSWDTRTMSNSNQYRLKLSCTDGTVWVEDISGTFSIRNERQVLSDTIFHHISGTGGGTLIAHIVDAAELTNHRYRITFDDTTSAVTTYDVYDMDMGILVVESAAEMDGQTEGPLFDGIRLVIYNYATAEVDPICTEWTIGNSDMTYHIYLPEINIGTEIVKGFAYPADYQITMYDHQVDTSYSLFGAPERPMCFTVWNITEAHQVDVIFVETDNDYTISRFENIYILEKDEAGQPMLTWLISFAGLDTSITPVAGDVFTMKTLKPFTHNDVFEFTPLPTGIASNETDVISHGFLLWHNYPNPFNPETSIRFYIPHRTDVTLKVYNIFGQEVACLWDDKIGAGFHTVTWNGTDSKGLKTSSGLYVCQLRAGSCIKTMKMLLLR